MIDSRIDGPEGKGPRDRKGTGGQGVTEEKRPLGSSRWEGVDRPQPFVGRPGHPSVGAADQSGFGHPSVDLVTLWGVRSIKAASATQGGLGHPSADLVTFWWVRPI